MKRGHFGLFIALILLSNALPLDALSSSPASLYRDEISPSLFRLLQTPLGTSACTTFGGNGQCDEDLNNEDCNWDRGDCCACTCKDTRDNSCGDEGYDCQDPDPQGDDCVPTPIPATPPTPTPNLVPTPSPTTPIPTLIPTPTLTTLTPTVLPTPWPTTPTPTVLPTPWPTTATPTVLSTPSPTTATPTVLPTPPPTTPIPTLIPTPTLTTATPTVLPTPWATTATPTVLPTPWATTPTPTVLPTPWATTATPTVLPTPWPTTPAPTVLPTPPSTTSTPTVLPTPSPTTPIPTLVPTSTLATATPTVLPTPWPTTPTPTVLPTPWPTTATPTVLWTLSPTTASPTVLPTPWPTTPAPTLVPTPPSTTSTPTVLPTPPPTTATPTLFPTPPPTLVTGSPTSSPTDVPATEEPVTQPPTSIPIVPPIPSPTTPTPAPTRTPTPNRLPPLTPSSSPMNALTATATPRPTLVTDSPTSPPTDVPATEEPVRQPPTPAPTVLPTPWPTTPTPTVLPTPPPTTPTTLPLLTPSSSPTNTPTATATPGPTLMTDSPTSPATTVPPAEDPITQAPSPIPTPLTTSHPTALTPVPTYAPILTTLSPLVPSSMPTKVPIMVTTPHPSLATEIPTSVQPSTAPSTEEPVTLPPTLSPFSPTETPTATPTVTPTASPTAILTASPTYTLALVTILPSDLATTQPPAEKDLPLGTPTTPPTTAPSLVTDSPLGNVAGAPNPPGSVKPNSSTAPILTPIPITETKEPITLSPSTIPTPWVVSPLSPTPIPTSGSSSVESTGSPTPTFESVSPTVPDNDSFNPTWAPAPSNSVQTSAPLVTTTFMSGTTASETVSIAAVGGIAASILGAILSRESAASIVTAAAAGTGQALQSTGAAIGGMSIRKSSATLAYLLTSQLQFLATFSLVDYYTTENDPWLQEFGTSLRWLNLWWPASFTGDAITEGNSTRRSLTSSSTCDWGDTGFFVPIGNLVLVVGILLCIFLLHLLILSGLEAYWLLEKRAKSEWKGAPRRGMTKGELMVRISGTPARQRVLPGANPDKDTGDDMISLDVEASTSTPIRDNHAFEGKEEKDEEEGSMVEDRSRHDMVDPIIECRDKSASAWLYFPHVELLFLFFAFEGFVAAQVYGVQQSGCLPVQIVAVVVLVLYPVLMFMGVSRTTLVRVCSKAIIEFRRLPDVDKHGGGCVSRSFISWRLDHSLFSWGDKGRWHTVQTSDESLWRQKNWFRIGFEPMFVDFTQSGAWFTIFFLLEWISFVCIAVLVESGTMQLFLFCGIHLGAFLMLVIFRPFANKVMDFIASIVSFINAVSMALMAASVLGWSDTTEVTRIDVTVAFLQLLVLLVLVVPIYADLVAVVMAMVKTQHCAKQVSKSKVKFSFATQRLDEDTSGDDDPTSGSCTSDSGGTLS